MVIMYMESKKDIHNVMSKENVGHKSVDTSFYCVYLCACVRTLSVLFYRRASSTSERLSNLPTQLGCGTLRNFDRGLSDGKLLYYHVDSSPGSIF